MIRYGIVDIRCDTTVFENRSNLIARRAADYVEMRDVGLAKIQRIFQGLTGQGGRVGGGDFPAAGIPTVEVPVRWRPAVRPSGYCGRIRKIDTCCSTRIDGAISLCARGARREW
jgi:hypothetical protein